MQRLSRAMLTATFVSTLLTLFLAAGALAQTTVVTAHNDISRTGQNTSETILTPANVNATAFGKLFSYPVDGQTYAQPLYVPGVTMGAGSAQPGTKHNVVFVATEHDSIFAFDADSNGGANASPLWKITLLDTAHGAAAGATTVPASDLSTVDINPEVGITGTPVINVSTNTLYVVGKTKENGTYKQRLHALDITTGAEKSGSPVTLAAQVAGNGTGSSGGVLNWDPKWENNRPGLLLLNGFIYIGFAAHGDNGPWHGWILAYNASTLQQTSAFCTTASGSGSGIWMSGAGLAADTVNSGRLFVATGNGAFNATSPYTNGMSYGDDFIRLNATNGVLSVADQFTPLNQSALNGMDTDVASGGVVLLPDQSVGGHTHLMIQAGKEGRIYLIDRDNMGGFNSASDNIVQEVPVNNASQSNQTFKIHGLWSSPAYWNGNIFIWGSNDSLKAFSFVNGKLGNLDSSNLPNPTSTSAATTGFPGATPAVSSNGTTNGIVWSVLTTNVSSNGPAVLVAYNAANVTNPIYSSTQNAVRDNPGTANKFVVPTVVNGKVYVGTANFLSVFGLLSSNQQAAMPILNPGGESFSGSISVAMTDSTAGASIYYTTDGSTPSTSSKLYTGPVAVTSSQTLNAIASASGFLQSAVASETYNLLTQAIAPNFSPSAGSFSSAQLVTITSGTTGAKIYYTTDGTTPTPGAGTTVLYSAPITVGSSLTLKAVATAAGLTNSPVSSAVYTIVSGASGVSYPSGFSASASTMAFNGSTVLNDTRLQLTNGGLNQAGSAWSLTPVDVSSFTNDFAFQLENADADGITFTMQNSGTTALGGAGGGLGYTGIGNSVAIKFDLYSNSGEGDDSVGIFQNGAAPGIPSTDLTGSGIDLHNGDTFLVHMTYNGTTLAMTITDGVTGVVYNKSWTINIPSVIGSKTAYVGFTGGTGGLTASQKIETWTFLSNAVSQPVGSTATPTFSPAGGTYASAQTVTISDATSGASIFYTKDGTTPATTAGGSTIAYTGPFSVASSQTIKAIAKSSTLNASSVASAAYTISSGSTSTPNINFATGFSATGLQLNGNATLVGSRLQLTNTSTTFEDASAFWNQKVNVQSFTNDFTFQILNPGADGFTFTLQGVGPAALGNSGGDLGYTGLGNSVAVKFDIYNNSGEGATSTGLYINGAAPTVPAVAFGGGVNLLSGDLFKVHMTYNGTTLTMNITDTANTAQTFTTSWPINIPSVLGATTAYAGFTGATGGFVATQQIVTWSYSNSSSTKTALVYQTATLAATAVTSGPVLQPLAYANFPDGNGVMFPSAAVGDNVTFTLNVPTAGTYDVQVGYKAYSPRGIMQTAVGATNLGSAVDQFIAVNDAYKIADLGVMNFSSAGNYKFKFTVMGKNASATGFSLSFDDITLTPQ
jgi:hypothetical protein